MSRGLGWCPCAAGGLTVEGTGASSSGSGNQTQATKFPLATASSGRLPTPTLHSSLLDSTGVGSRHNTTTTDSPARRIN